jgi:hypothetical protein
LQLTCIFSFDKNSRLFVIHDMSGKLHCSYGVTHDTSLKLSQNERTEGRLVLYSEVFEVMTGRGQLFSILELQHRSGPGV